MDVSLNAVGYVWAKSPRTKWLAVPLLGISSTFYAQSGFVHPHGRNLVSPDGTPLHLKGTNLGNWFEPEGYTSHLDDGPQSPREMEDLVNQLIGREEAAQFWHEYRDAYIPEDDIKFLHEAGLNSIRIPFHYKLSSPETTKDFASWIVSSPGPAAGISNVNWFQFN